MEHRPRRLMILGAGYEQLPAIIKSAGLGYFVITVDNVPGNIGHIHSNLSVNVSTVEKDRVLSASKQLHIDGITTFASDIAMPSVAYVAEKLWSRGCGLSVTEVMCHKGRFRRVQRNNGLNSPPFVAAKVLDDMLEDLIGLGDHLVFKPVDASGSRGIRSVKNGSFREWERAFHSAQRHSRSGGVCVEAFIDGLDIGGNGFLSKGKLKFAVLTKKFVSGFVVRGHFLPAPVSEEERHRVVKEIEANCAATGLKEGPVDFDVRLSSRGATVVEMSPRLGGNGIPELIERATKTDLTKMTLAFALGDAVCIPDNRKACMCCGSYVFGSPVAGVINNITSKKMILSSIPEVFSYTIKFRKGDRVPAFEHGGGSMGRIVFECDDESHYHRVVGTFREVLGLRVLPDDSPG